MDFETLKTLYVQGAGNCRTLAKEYEIPYRELCAVAKEEGWAALKKQAKKQACAYPSGEGVLETAHCLLAKMLGQIKDAERIESGVLKQYTAALKDLRDILGFIPPSQLEEAQLKLENLRQKNQKTDLVEQIQFQVLGGEDQWVQ